MLFYIIIGLTISACFAADNTSPPPIRCGEIPNSVYPCLGNPRFIKVGMVKNCNFDSECEKMTCVFTNAGWLKDGKVETSKVSAYCDQFVKDFPQWSPAVQQAKANCLVPNLPAQGAYLNCPAYDIVLCILTSFIQYAEPSQWSTVPECQYPRQYAAVCAPCPVNCFAPLVPYGSCNACLTLPRQ